MRAECYVAEPPGECRAKPPEPSIVKRQAEKLTCSAYQSNDSTKHSDCSTLGTIAHHFPGLSTHYSALICGIKIALALMKLFGHLLVRRCHPAVTPQTASEEV